MASGQTRFFLHDQQQREHRHYRVLGREGGRGRREGGKGGREGGRGRREERERREGNEKEG